MKKKAVMITCACLAGAVVIGGISWLIWGRGGSFGDDHVAYVNTVEKLMSLGSGNGMTNRFAGVAESQNTWSVQQNAEKTVKEVLVEVGQEVQAGSPLFSYDTDKFQTDLEQAQLNLERINNEADNMGTSISQLQKDKKSASKEDQASLQLQIQEAELQLKQKEYEGKSKQIEIDKLRENINNATVSSEIAGVVKAINNNSDGTDQYGTPDSASFITILGTGDYRIKGKINEQNVGALTEGDAVIIHSRVNDKDWKGTVTKIDRENAETGNGNSNRITYGEDNNMTQTSSYPFYVALEENEGLMLGQHVYIESDFGQDEEPKAGIWLEDYFVNDIDSNPYVWADNGKGRLEKRYVTLGQHDDALFQYEIADGLAKEDAVTFPDEGLKEGMKTAVSEDGQMGQGNPGAIQGENNSDMDNADVISKVDADPQGEGDVQ